MSKPIKNPYVAIYSKIGRRSWDVLFRYLIADKIKFKMICSCTEASTAKKIARLMNKDYHEKRDEPCDL